MQKPSMWILFALVLCGALWVVLASGQTPEPLGDDYKLSVGYYDFSPDIDMDARGNFVVVWSRGSPFYPDWDVWGRRYSSDGKPISDEFRVNDGRSGRNQRAEVAVSPDGKFVVVWHALPDEPDPYYPSPSSPNDIRGRRFDPKGRPLAGDFLVASESGDYELNTADVDAGPRGDFVVVWQRDAYPRGTIHARRYSSMGAPLEDEFRVNVEDTVIAYFPAVHWTPDGGFIVVWVTIEGGRGQRYSSEGFPVGPPFSVHDEHASGITSSIDVAPSGQFVVAWMEFEDYSFQDIDLFARTFSSDGDPLTDRFQVNTTTMGIQELPSVALERGGEFVVVWDSRTPVGTDDYGYSVQGQRFSSVGGKVGFEFQVNTTTTSHQFSPKVAALPGKGFVVAWSSFEDFPYNAYIRGRRFGPTPAFCTPAETMACLNRGRFRVEVEWTNPSGLTGPGRRVHFGSDDSALFWFFSPDNWEMLVKVLDGCAINHRFWVFAASTTNVAYVLRVTDTETGEVREYENPPGKPADAVTDADAFATCR